MELHLESSAVVIEGAKAYAQETLTGTGRVPAFVFLHRTDGGVFPIPYKQHEFPPVSVQQAAIVALIRAMKERSLFAGAVMVSEAWASRPSSEALVGVLRPSLDPDRTEVLIISVLAFDGTGHTAIFEITRETGKPVIGKKMDIDAAEGWMLDALKEV